LIIENFQSYQSSAVTFRVDPVRQDVGEEEDGDVAEQMQVSYDAVEGVDLFSLTGEYSQGKNS
jgi:hypothetical protein